MSHGKIFFLSNEEKIFGTGMFGDFRQTDRASCYAGGRECACFP